MLTCVTFDNGWGHVQGHNGIYVKNDGVKVVSGDCRRSNCGYFDGHSFLSIPFFKNNSPRNGVSVSFFFKGNVNGRVTKATMISNQCVKPDYNHVTRGVVVTGEGSLSISLKDSYVSTDLVNDQRNAKSVTVRVSTTCLSKASRIKLNT